MRAVTVLALLGALAGCSRTFYRHQADRDSYRAIAERNDCPTWQLPRTDIDPPSTSRLFDPSNPDRPPMPPDDPAAHRYMHCANGMRGYRHWHKDGDLPAVEWTGWREELPLNDKGSLVLTPERSVELALLHSREYQTELENVYLQALALTLNRFEFMAHWFAANNTFFTHFGSGPTESNALSSDSSLGFTQNLAAGGQLLVEFANSVVVEFTGRQTTVSSNILVNLIQPLLRGAGREVRMETLTQGERSLLYAVREFARFRKAFYANVATRGNGFLSLLLQAQTIRNLEANLEAQQQNLRLHEALYAGGIVSLVQVDQAFQSYQQARLLLITQQARLETALDDFKLQLGLPVTIPIELDDTPLASFQLADPALTKQQEEVEALLKTFRERDAAPTLAELRAGYTRLRSFPIRTGPFLDQLAKEIERLRLRASRPLGAGEEQSARDREKATYEAQAKQLPALREELRQLLKNIDRDATGLTEDRRGNAWQSIQRRAREQIALLGQVFVVQTQVRVYLIELPAVSYQETDAIAYALGHRLDLMNERGRVVDAWRLITVTADGLEPDLNLVVNANTATRPGSLNPFDFSFEASRYQVGFQFDGPLNRYAERNIYRTSLVNYQRARRTYTALEDTIVLAVRSDLRTLATERLGFEISRQTLISAARQVENARASILLSERGTDTKTDTINIINALNGLLSARNALVGSYVNYETIRLQLLLDLESLQLDARGLPPDDRTSRQPEQPQPEHLPAPHPVDGGTAGPADDPVKAAVATPDR